MDSKSFIERKIRYLNEIFPQIKCLYFYTEKLKFHSIEVKPNDLYENDKIFIDIRKQIYSEFDSLFPSETIMFYTE